MRLRTAFLWTMIGSLALAAAMGVVAILFDAWGNTEEQVLITSLLVGTFSLTALASAIVLDRYRFRVVAWIGITSSMLALIDWLVWVWFESGMRNDLEEFIIKMGFTLAIAAVWCPHIGLLRLLRLNRTAYRVVRWVTWIAASLLALILVGVVWVGDLDEWVGRLIGVLAILTASGTAMTPVLALIQRVRQRDSTETIQRHVEIDLTCPRCLKGQRIQAGASKCVHCGLKIHIDVEEPRCHCGYLLYQLEGESCPECGRSIDPQRIWKQDVKPDQDQDEPTGEDSEDVSPTP
ncbi:MAG: zinc ribbon domain-containing protein [Planctomycetota bacterium]|nr:zinc ribbon domain-containing protein [Planctomycetota bacterium]